MDRWYPLLRIGQVALVALAVMAPGAALAGQPGDTAPETIVCVVSGYDVIIYNRSAGPIAPGVSVSWSVPFLRMSGSHELATELEPEGRVFLSGVLGGGGFLSPNQTCIAAFE